jgi:hypothetical protein
MIERNRFFIFLTLLSGIACAEQAIPEKIQVPPGNKIMMTVHAKGDQIYQCTLDKGRHSWVVEAPDAQLFDDQGRVVGNHYSGPVWEYKEGSRVVGRVLKKVDMAPGTSISWLLVEVVAHKGKGLLSEASFINRINTHGGLAPMSGCDGNHLGGEKRVAYSADYVFYSPSR